MKALIISGPTGSGKTDLALKLSQTLGFRIVNADAFQFYRELPILSNQPSDRGPFELLGHRSLQEPISAGQFAREAEGFLATPRIWVGTGLYLGAAFYGLDPDRRKGTPFQGKPRAEFQMIVLDPDRKELYDRLDRRVEDMMRLGALDEARRIHSMIESQTIAKTNPVLRAIGLKHLLLYIGGEMSQSEALRLWQRDTRRLAKRQWTWLRKFCAPAAPIRWIRDSRDPFLNEVCELFKSF